MPQDLVVIVIIILLSKCKVKQLLALLTDDRLLVTTFNIVPLDTILQFASEISVQDDYLPTL